MLSIEHETNKRLVKLIELIKQCRSNKEIFDLFDNKVYKFHHLIQKKKKKYSKMSLCQKLLNINSEEKKFRVIDKVCKLKRN